MFELHQPFAPVARPMPDGGVFLAEEPFEFAVARRPVASASNAGARGGRKPELAGEFQHVTGGGGDGARHVPEACPGNGLIIPRQDTLGLCFRMRSSNPNPLLRARSTSPRDAR